MWPLFRLPETDSTNEACKRRAGCAPEFALLADAQTAGKGRLGRSFQSLPGKGLYLSLLLRPRVSPETAGRLTPWAAVAVCRAVERLTGLTPAIKWPNDVLWEGKKLCGILTELRTAPDGALDYLVLGIGVNLTQTPADFGPQLAPIAVSLAQMGCRVDRDTLAQTLLEELWELYSTFPGDKAGCLARYRALCVTPGREVVLRRPGGEVAARALDVTEDFSLLVEYPDGRREAVSSGEVSVRGLLGYS